MLSDPDRLFVGIGTVYGEACVNDGRVWQSEMFQQFLECEVGIPLRVDHGVLLNSRGVIASVGTVRRFASVDYPVRGLLILAEIDHAEGYGDQLLRDLEVMMQQSWLPPSWGLSIGALVSEDVVVPYEVSIVRKPAFDEARILAVGPEAMNVWQMLTERRIVADR
jgi:hypothetical protein